MNPPSTPLNRTGPTDRTRSAATDLTPLAPRCSTLRWPAAAAALVAAAAHLPVIPQHLAEVPYIGWLFIGLAATCGLGAAALVVRDAAVVWVSVSSTCLSAVVGYALSRGPGLPGMADDLGDWTNTLGLISVVTETLVVLLAVAALSTSAGSRRRRPMLWIPAGAAGLVAVTYLLGLVAT